MSDDLLTGPAFRPRDQMLLLAMAFDSVGPEHTDELMPLVLTACDYAYGGPPAKAYVHIDRARHAIATALSTPNDHDLPGGFF